MPILFLLLGLGVVYAYTHRKPDSKTATPVNKIPIGAYVVLYASSKTGDKGSNWFSDKTEAIKFAKGYKDTPGYQVTVYQEKGEGANPLKVEIGADILQDSDMK